MEFDWDEGNQEKNRGRHNVSQQEAESVFFDPGKLRYPDPKHSTAAEPRFVLTGRTEVGRRLFIIYTIRDNKVRVISARDLNKKREANLI